MAISVVAAAAFDAAPAQAQFARLIGFGDSYADTGSAPGGAYRLIGQNGTGTVAIPYPPYALVPSDFWPCPSPTYTSCRFTGSTNFVDSLQSIYGLPGLTNFSIGGARTGNTNTMPFLSSGYGLPYELQQFVASGMRLTDRDLVALSIGGNDLSGINVGTGDVASQTAIIVSSAQLSAAAAVGGVQQLVAAGARNIAWLGTGSSKWFPERTLGSQGTTLGQFNFSDSQRDAWADTYYQQTQLLLAPLAQAGVRVFLFNFGILQQRVHDNPGMYGFAGVPAGSTGCEAGPGTGSTPGTVAVNVAGCFYENSVHPTGAAMALIASYMANQIDAPSTVTPQSGIAAGLLGSFTGSVFDRLDANRRFQPSGVNAAMAAMPGKAPALTDPADHWSVYGAASYAGASRDRQFYATGYDYDAAGGYLGLEYRLDANWRVGGVFGYSQPDVKLAVQDARNRIDAFQFAGYGSYTDAHWFADTLLAYGRQDFALQRRGIIDIIRGSTSADVFTIAGKGGYLFDVGRLRLGPIAGLNYTNAAIRGYTETGDVLLTMMVDRQKLDALTGDLGVQLRYPLQIGSGIYAPFLNLIAAHDFLRSGHTVTTTLVSAPLLPILTPVSADGGTYGRVAGGVSATVATNVTATLTGTTSFARKGGDDAGVSGGLKIAF
ncbi:autotransporter domain-containing protein [Rhodopseudomonas sp. B29]|uniref:autotransporter domain-containing protein n=1 Tax=Rhodopseudomonas sp. B29 TaxID=95607 RepID=UPI0003B6500C